MIDYQSNQNEISTYEFLVLQLTTKYDKESSDAPANFTIGKDNEA